MVKTMDCGSIMRGFESHYPPHFYKADDGVSPSGKAMDSDSIMRRFESCYPSQQKDPKQMLRVFCISRGTSVIAHEEHGNSSL